MNWSPLMRTKAVLADHACWMLMETRTYRGELGSGVSIDATLLDTDYMERPRPLWRWRLYRWQCEGPGTPATQWVKEKFTAGIEIHIMMRISSGINTLWFSMQCSTRAIVPQKVLSRLKSRRTSAEADIWRTEYNWWTNRKTKCPSTQKADGDIIIGFRRMCSK